MKTLLLLRHAKSDWSEPDLSDHDRPLNQRGQRDAPRMGRLIKDRGLVPGLIVSSTARRAHATARSVAEQCGYPGEIDLAPRLYHALPEAYLDHLQEVPDRHAIVLIVGHNPGLEDLLELLTGSYQKMPTAALAQVLLDTLSWQDLPAAGGQLVNFWRPKDQPG